MLRLGQRHISKGVSLLTPRSLPPMAPKRMLSSIPEGNERDDIDRVELLRRKYRKALNPTPIKGIDVGDSEEVLDPQIKIKVILNYHSHYKML